MSSAECPKLAGLFAAWTPDELLAKVPEMVDRSTVGFQPLLGGLAPEEGWKSLRLIEQLRKKESNEKQLVVAVATATPIGLAPSAHTTVTILVG